MDEILIGEKKYISSKQAAKLTGYAKDYVGQLCREGRVPARLVGRSWYVLESAIQDHRFSDAKIEPDKTEKPKPSAESPIQSTWESPRYEASRDELLPSVNRLQNRELSVSEEKNEGSDVANRLQDTWQAWFDRFDHGSLGKSGAAAMLQEPEGANDEPEIEQSEEVDIPIHTVHQIHYQLPPEELLPNIHSEPEPQNKRIEERGGSRALVRAVRLMGALVALVAVIAAALGSGYFDKYIISNSQVSIIAGVGVYNK